MKKIIICTMLFTISATVFGQQKKSSPDLTKQDYLQKSKKQKTIGWIILGAGASTAIAGAFIPREETVNPWTLEKETVGGEALYALGGLVAVSSIPFFIASGRNKRKGMSLSIKNETAPQLLKGIFVNSTVPSVAIKINL